MRLITFQDKVALNVLKDDVWYSARDNRMKCVDYDYVDEEEHYPIYTFASTQLKHERTFGLSWLYASACHLARFMQFDLEQRVLIELEVPEDFILNMKQVEDWFEQRCSDDDQDHEVTRTDYKHERYWVKRDLSKGEVFTGDFLQHVRKEGLEYELEALIPCIKKEHIAAIRSFVYKYEKNGDELIKCKTIYSNESLTPLWSGTVYLSGDGYPRFNSAEDADILMEIAEFKAKGFYPCKSLLAIQKYGAKSVQDYWTISECLSCCCEETAKQIKKIIDVAKIAKDDYDTMTIEEAIIHAMAKINKAPAKMIL